MIGDVVQSADKLNIDIDVLGASPIERMVLFDGEVVLQIWRTEKATAAANRVRTMFEGSEYRGRGREVRSPAELTIDGAKVEREERFNVFNFERRFEIDAGRQRISSDTVTTCNFSGVGSSFELDFKDFATAPDLVFERGDLGNAFESFGFLTGSSRRLCL